MAFAFINKVTIEGNSIQFDGLASDGMLFKIQKDHMEMVFLSYITIRLFLKL